MCLLKAILSTKVGIKVIGYSLDKPPLDANFNNGDWPAEKAVQILNLLTSWYEAVTRYSYKCSISLFSCTSKPSATCRIETLEVITALIMLLINATTLRVLWNFGDIIDRQH